MCSGEVIVGGVFIWSDQLMIYDVKNTDACWEKDINAKLQCRTECSYKCLVYFLMACCKYMVILSCLRFTAGWCEGAVWYCGLWKR